MRKSSSGSTGLELKKSKSLELITVQTTSAYHANASLNAKYTPKDLYSLNKLVENKNVEFKDILKTINLDLEKSQEIKCLIEDTKEVNCNLANKSLSKLEYTYKRALHHYCFSDIISQNEDTVTIVFLPISTSNRSISCGIQSFDKIYLYTKLSNEHTKNETNFYITRLLFYKKMSLEDYHKWVNENNTKFESDFKIRNQDRMFIFNEIQKDLRQNQYSVLRDSDILDPKMDFLVKKLPLTDFEFTDLIL